MLKTYLAIVKNGQIELIEPLSIAEGTQVLITLLPSPNDTQSNREWMNFAWQGLDKAYGTDEPDYPLDLVKEFNPEHERR